MSDNIIAVLIRHQAAVKKARKKISAEIAAGQPISSTQLAKWLIERLPGTNGEDARQIAEEAMRTYLPARLR
jgi:hypothetical protein